MKKLLLFACLLCIVTTAITQKNHELSKDFHSFLEKNSFYLQHNGDVTFMLQKQDGNYHPVVMIFEGILSDSITSEGFVIFEQNFRHNLPLKTRMVRKYGEVILCKNVRNLSVPQRVVIWRTTDPIMMFKNDGCPI